LELLRLSRTYKTARRLQRIINVFLRHGFGRIVDQIHLGRYIPFSRRLKTFGQWPALKGPSVPERLRTAFAELGPSFVKFAQLLSSRPDLITTRYANELKKLQDEVPPFPFSVVERMIEEELGMPINRIFLDFTEKPIAAASIAQVHMATLLDGSDVIVKVQRPDIKEQIETDIDILTTVSKLMEKYIPESRFFNPTGIVEEFSKTVTKELDFTLEGKNCQRFGRNFEQNPHVYIPKIFPRHLTEKILVMERIEGVRIDNIKGIEEMGLDRADLAKTGVNAYFKMILEDGFFHADPHPGNIFAMPTGQIGFMDFGIVGRVSEELKEAMANTFLAVLNRDFDRLIDLYIELGYVSEDVDLEEFRREFKAELSEFLEPLYGLTLREINFSEYLNTIVRIAMKHNMKIPSDLLLINKAMLILENIGVQLDPNFDFISASEPYASKLIRKKFSPGKIYETVSKNITEAGDFVLLLPKQMKKIIRKLLRDDIHFKLTHIGLENFIRDMDRSSNRISFAMIISSILISSAIMHATGVGPTVYGMSVLGFLTFGFAALLGIWLIISIIRSGRF
jgi:ubiquinone biosynthesis protein